MIKKPFGRRQTLGQIAFACCTFFGLAGQAIALDENASSQKHSAANPPITATQRQMAQAAVNGVDTKWISPNAPSSYTVKSGDTLWRIAGVFLRSPWRWPALWGLNSVEVRNPHLIYPGEVLNLEIRDGKARLTRGGQSNAFIRLSPSVRVSEQLAAAIPTIPFSAIGPFLVKPVMVDDALFANSATVFATKDNRLNVGTGGRLYATGLPADAVPGDVFSIYRPGRAVRDPDIENRKDPRALLGVEAVFLGEARLVKKGDGDGASTMEVTNASQEIGRGDRMLAMPKEIHFEYAPHAPTVPVKGRVVMMHDGRTGTSLLASNQQDRDYETEGGPLSIVVLNRGANDGLESGHVLKLVRPAKMVQDRSTLGHHDGEKVMAPQKMPAEEYGTVMVFKTFSRVSYGIVMDASTSVLPGDEVVGAEDDQ